MFQADQYWRNSVVCQQSTDSAWQPLPRPKKKIANEAGSSDYLISEEQEGKPPEEREMWIMNEVAIASICSNMFQVYKFGLSPHHLITNIRQSFNFQLWFRQQHESYLFLSIPTTKPSQMESHIPLVGVLWSPVSGLRSVDHRSVVGSHEDSRDPMQNIEINYEDKFKLLMSAGAIA